MATTRYLGQFLLEQAAISSEQLKAALAVQELQRDKSMAARARSAGFLSQEDADRILASAKESHRPFLDVAHSEGLLTAERLENLRAGLMDEQVTLGDALVEVGALTTDKLAGYVEECNRDVCEGAESVEGLLSGQHDPELLKVITNQFSQAFLNTLQVFVSPEQVHNDVQKVAACDFSIYQSFKGDFEGEIYLNLSAPLMLRIASKLLAEETANVGNLVVDGACEFHNIVNGNICAQLSAMGRKVDLDPPRYFRHPEWGERLNTPFDLEGRVGGANFTVVTFAHASEKPELYIVNRTPS